MNDINGLWEDLVPYQFNLTLNLNQGFALFRQNQTLIAQALQIFFLKHLVKISLDITNNGFPLTKGFLPLKRPNSQTNSTLSSS